MSMSWNEFSNYFYFFICILLPSFIYWYPLKIDFCWTCCQFPKFIKINNNLSGVSFQNTQTEDFLNHCESKIFFRALAIPFLLPIGKFEIQNMLSHIF